MKDDRYCEFTRSDQCVHLASSVATRQTFLLNVM
ncbi:rCG34178 [Rattus norvegicus]|uniref:RCG34178 n=1 Tax=Rattus norvegicus TaxID=10116 RepID=A6HH80_RAT|nr:rCG34178 [Rattus norvegicus]